MPGVPRQGGHCESHVGGSLPLPKAGTILRVMLLSLGQRSQDHSQQGEMRGLGPSQCREMEAFGKCMMQT